MRLIFFTFLIFSTLAKTPAEGFINEIQGEEARELFHIIRESHIDSTLNCTSNYCELMVNCTKRLFKNRCTINKEHEVHGINAFLLKYKLQKAFKKSFQTLDAYCIFDRTQLVIEKKYYCKSYL